MVKRFFLIIGLVLMLGQNITLAQDASMQTKCINAEKLGFPKCADSPSECGSIWEKNKYKTPFNCVFLTEPIGGRTGYDLYKLKIDYDGEAGYELWFGQTLIDSAATKEYGPFQAILAYEPGKESEGSFTLLNNYLKLIYNFMSGVIVAVVILMVIVGGIRISAAGGNADSESGGKEMITKALIGMVLWFTASVILYTINPTFFAF